MTQRCRVCGCTDDNAILCVALSGGPCWWVEKDLCSRCAPDQLQAWLVLAQQIAKQVAQEAVVPGVIVTMLDRRGHLHVGVAAVDDPVSAPLLTLAGELHEAVERIEAARGDAPRLAPRPPPQTRAACIHCMQDVAAVDDVEAIKRHSTTCAASPVVQELARVREDLAALQRNLKPIDVVLDGPPGHDAGRFVEVENAERKSISVGTWIDRGDGCWALRIWADCTPASAKEPHA